MPDEAEDLIHSSLSKLVEHFDSALIVCTVNEDGRTRLRVRYIGNYYASVGAATEWLADEKAKDAAFHTAQEIAKTRDEEG